MSVKCGTIMLIGCALPFIVGCQVAVQKDIPAPGTVKYNAVVYAENDGRCADGKVIKITGGNRGKDIPRSYECIAKP